MGNDEFQCGTCGDVSLVLAVGASRDPHGYAWIVSCRNGHRFIPIPGNVISIWKTDHSSAGVTNSG